MTHIQGNLNGMTKKTLNGQSYNKDICRTNCWQCPNSEIITEYVFASTIRIGQKPQLLRNLQLQTMKNTLPIVSDYIYIGVNVTIIDILRVIYSISVNTP